MLKVTKGTETDIVVTLTEKTTLSNGYYLFTFIHNTTKETISKIFNFNEDLSSYTDRFNKFTLPASLFTTATRGEWQYRVYEQSSAVNTDPTGLAEVENGMMYLEPSDLFEFEENAASTTYKVYNG